MRKNFLILLPLFLLLFAGCTEKQAKEAIHLIPFLGGDEEINQAVMDKDIEQCAKLDGKDDLARLRRQNNCVEKVARAMQEYSACFLIKETNGSGEVNGKAARECATEIAIDTANLSICEEIDNFNYDVTKCYAGVAPLLKDASICAKAGEGATWTKCIKETAVASEKIEICDNFEASGSKGSCQADVAVIKKDASLCAQIEREDFRNNCYNNIASETKDASLCENLSSDTRKQRCREGIEETE